MYEVDKLPSTLDIGYIGETGFRKVEIDMTAWVNEIPDGIPSIVHIRPSESASDAYICDTTFANNILTWVITSGDLGSVEGRGTLQVWIEEYESDSVTKRGKSILLATLVHNSLGEPSSTVPDPQESWLESMTALKDATVAAASAAETATEHQPYIDSTSGNWMVWDTTTSAFVDTEIHAQGPAGEDGADGQDGQDGQDGHSPVVTASKSGSVTTVYVDGTSIATINDGTDGQNGTNGTNGTDGTSAYVYIKYAASEPTQDSDMKDTPDAWMGTYSGTASTAPTSYTNYDWYNIKGAKGATGQTGPAGQDGADGEDGHSPVVTASKSDGVTTVYVDGSSIATINDGEDGQDGQDGQNGADGQDGADGADGTTFTPSVSSAGVISWTNDGGKTNPSSVDLVTAVINALPSAVGVSF